MQIQPDHRLFSVHAWSAARAFAELIANGVLDPSGSILRMRERGIAHIAIHCQCVVWRHPLIPVDGPHSVVEFFGRPDIEFMNGAQHTDCRAEPEAGAVEHGGITVERNSSASGLHLGSAKGSQFAREYWLQSAGTGRKIAGHHASCWISMMRPMTKPIAAIIVS